MMADLMFHIVPIVVAFALGIAVGIEWAKWAGDEK